MQGTIAAIERHLCHDNLVYRYTTSGDALVDGLPAGEGAFLACSFWLAADYALSGRPDHARALFEHLLSLRNDLGLLAEEYDTRLRRQLGNFPQAFSHVALIMAAHVMDDASRKQRTLLEGVRSSGVRLLPYRSSLISSAISCGFSRQEKWPLFARVVV
jgi:GH15 family glucan-1,4-alpha-glucosidase